MKPSWLWGVSAPLLALTFVAAGYWRSHAAPGEQRIALVIGNGAYQKTTPLTNPVNDARLTAERLQVQGFAVSAYYDVSQRDMKRAVAAFTDQLKASGKDAAANAGGSDVVAVRTYAPEAAAGPKVGETIQDCADCPEMGVVPAGSFMMGSPSDEPERESLGKGTESPRRRVTIGQPFAVGKYAVTVDQFKAFVSATGHKMDGGCWVWDGTNWKSDAAKSFLSPGFEQDGSHPAVCVSWDDAQAYVKWLSKKTGQSYRLPSEAEREYFARAGTDTPFWWGSSITPDQANYDGKYVYAGGGKKGEYRRKTVPVKSFQANPWGLYQVHGNVWEWTQDCWNDNHDDAPADEIARTTGDCGKRVVRGGSWNGFPEGLRAAFRHWVPSVVRFSFQGFRVARTLNPAS